MQTPSEQMGAMVRGAARVRRAALVVVCCDVAGALCWLVVLSTLSGPLACLLSTALVGSLYFGGAIGRDVTRYQEERRRHEWYMQLKRHIDTSGPVEDMP